MVDPVLGKDVRIRPVTLAMLIWVPVEFWRCLLKVVVVGIVKVYLGLFGEGRELEVMLREYREAGLIPEEEPLCP